MRKKISSSGQIGSLTFLILVTIFLSSCKNRVAIEQIEEALIKTDREFSDFSVQNGMNNAFIEYAADDIVLLKPNHMPVTGIEALKDYYSAVDDDDLTLSWKPLFAKAARSSELGYTYGTWKLEFPGGVEEGTYTSIWEKDLNGQWKLVLDTGNEGLTNIKSTHMAANEKPRVTGIGGIFFKCADNEVTRDWYRDHLGFETDQYGSMFKFHDYGKPDKVSFLQWSPFPDDTKYFDPSDKEFMINYRVNDLAGLVENLKKQGVTILDEIEEYDYGKFIHILDNEGNKIELWEPVDAAFENPDS